MPRGPNEVRYEPADSLDYFPTPGWATRALFKHVLPKSYGGKRLDQMTALEPACGAGHMADVLKEYMASVTVSDIEDYGYQSITTDYLDTEVDFGRHDWMITNPPFNKAEEFINKALSSTDVGIAVFCRLAFLESKGRYHNLYKTNPPTKAAVFAERVPLVKGTIDRTASSATAYAWLVWEHQNIPETELLWIPPCRSELEREEDYKPR